MEIIREEIDSDILLDEAQSFITGTCPSCQAPLGPNGRGRDHKNNCIIWYSGISIDSITNVRPCYITCAKGVRTIVHRHYPDWYDIKISVDHYLAICDLTEVQITDADFLVGFPDGIIKLTINGDDEIRKS